MTTSYKLTNHNSVLRNDGAWIPCDPANGDYREYTEWLGVGNLPEPADPIPVIPLAVSPRQIRQALTRAELRNVVEVAVLNGSQDLKDWWEFATVFEEGHPEVINLCAALGKSDEERRALFVLAASL